MKTSELIIELVDKMAIHGDKKIALWVGDCRHDIKSVNKDTVDVIDINA